MKKFSKLATAFITVGLLLASCGGASKSDMQQIGILQLAEHASLDDARKGFIEELAANGYVDGENIRVYFGDVFIHVNEITRGRGGCDGRRQAPASDGSGCDERTERT